MRSSSLRRSFALVSVAPWCVALACGGQQGAPAPSAPIIVESASAAAAPSPPPAPAPEPPKPVASASATPAEDDPMTARGNMWGDAIGDSFGAGGLGLVGTGSGDGGVGEGIGLGNIGTIGHGAGTGTGQGFGTPRLHGATASSPTLRQGATTVSGRLAPEIIQRIVRQNFGRYRLCYENGLRKDPTLSGRVTVKFVIDASGAVKSPSDGGSTLSDKTVVSCVVRGFANLSFPQPEKGEVTVAYPIIFAPGDPAPPPSASASAAPPAKK